MSNSRSPESMQERRLQDFRKFQHYAATTLVIAAPILIALPPRKLDFYTFGLCGAFVISANHIVYERTGLPILENIGARKRAREAAEEGNAKAMKAVEERNAAEAAEKKKIGIMTGLEAERESWKLKRMREEREMLESGKSYQDMIVEQVEDVWKMLKGEKRGGEDGGESERGGKTE